MATRKWIVGLVLLAVAPACAGAVVYQVTCDMSSISGISGSLYFAFGPGFSPVDATSVTISDFSGGTLGPGILPDPLTLDNAAPSTYEQTITYGNEIRFRLTFSGPGVDNPTPGSNGSDFALYLLNGSQSALLTDDPNGAILTGAIDPEAGVILATFTNGGSASPVSFNNQSTPEPAQLPLLGGAVWWFWTRRGRGWGKRSAGCGRERAHRQ